MIIYYYYYYYCHCYYYYYYYITVISDIEMLVTPMVTLRLCINLRKITKKNHLSIITSIKILTLKIIAILISINIFFK